MKPYKELICILAAIGLHASNGKPSLAVENAEAIVAIVDNKYPDNTTDSKDLRSDR
jgi:hypothetical protein